MTPLAALAVAAGGAVGSLARWSLAYLFLTLGVTGFPWSTLLANVSGSFLIGLILAVARNGRSLAPELELFLIVGVCGGYTTFSSFSIQTLELVMAGAWLRASLYVLASVAICLLAVWLGWQAGLGLARTP